MKPVLYNVILTMSVMTMLVPQASAWRGAGEVGKGNRLYARGEFDSAIAHYEQGLAKEPRSTAIEYDLGTALYKKGQYNQAIGHLNNALLTDDVNLRPRVHFNLGNSFYKAGIQKEESNIFQAIASLEKSLPQYQKALAIDAKDADAKYNYEFVKKELERLKRKKQQQDEQKQNQSQKDKQGGQSSSDRQQNQEKTPPNNDQNKSPQDDSASSNSRQDQSQNPDKKENASDNRANDRQNPEDQKQPPEHKSPQSQPSSSDENRLQDNGEQSEGHLTPQEANMVLGDYQRNEEPKGMLYFVPQNVKESAVTKDW